MRSFHKRIALGLLIAALTLAGCSADDPSAPTATGNVFPVHFAALGNSLTAGFMNGGLIEGGQNASFARLIVKQAGWADVAQPTISSPGIGPSGSALYVDETGAVTVDTVANPLALLANSTYPVPYDNMGVPGATTWDVLNATSAETSQGAAAGQPNGFFDMILRNGGLPPGGTTQFDQVKSLHPEVMTLWIGSNDILGGATGGDPVVGQNITPSATWEALVDAVFDSVETIGAREVAVANIPGIPTTPYFTTVPLGQVIDTMGTTIPWETDEEDVAYILLPAGSILDATYLPAPYGLGTASLPSTMTLTTAEAAAVTDVIDAYNSHIASEAAARGWALADMAGALASLGTDPAELNRLFAWSEAGQNVNSAFGLDGIHPSEKGYAKVANVFIEALNSTYGETIPTVDISSVSNVTGFEQAPGLGFVPPHGKRSAIPRFTKSGLAALDALPAFLGTGR